MSIRNLTLVMTVFFHITFSVFADYNPPPGGADIEDLFSSSFLGSGSDVTAVGGIDSDSFNPAVSGLRERTAINGGYISLIGVMAGHVVNAGATFPTRFGVFGGSLNFVTTPMLEMNLGTFLRTRLNFSRELVPNFLIGLGANLYTGRQDRVYIGIMGDIGFLHILPESFGLPGFRWGFVFKGLGLPYDPDTAADISGVNRSSFPPPFTPVLGITFNPVDTGDAVLSLSAQVSAPVFQGIKTSVHANFTYKSFITGTLGWRYDFTQQASADASVQRSLIPSLGVKFNLTNLLGNKTREKNREGLQFETAAAPLYNGAWGVGLGFEVPLTGVDRDAPVISVSYPETEIISPNNDGKSDLLEFNIDIRDDGLIKGYNFVITDVAGNVVREYRNVEVRPENIGLGNIIGQLTAEDQSVPVPEKLIWNGRTESGFVVDDGTYAFRIEAWDNRGNKSSTKLYKVVVDKEKPRLMVATPAREDLLFSPDGDGNKDIFTIEQTGSAEEQITAQIIDSDGNPVREWTWHGSSPEDITWDGKNDNEESVEDGIYAYKIVSEDRAENTASGIIENIIVNTQVVSVFLSTDRSGFSPNSDGTADTVTLFPHLSTTEGLDSWKIEIYSETAGTVHQFSGGTEVPESLVWTGFTDQGEVVEGIYRASLSAEYTSGAEPQAVSRSFILDVSAPDINVSLSPSPFSPDNDGVDDRLQIDMGISDTSSIKNWKLMIMDDRGGLFNSFSGSSDPGRALIWNGVSSDGELVQSAKDYPYTLSVTDVLGNTAETEGFIPVDVLVIREDGKLKIRISNITFEPNSPELVTQDVKVFEKNIDILNRIAETLKKYASYDVRIEGHAVRVHWDDKELGAKEEREELVPLSRDRARTVKDALTERGIEPDRLSVKGIGGQDPLVPHSDLDNRWKNRRVEFILLK